MSDFTTIQIPKDLRDLIKAIASANERSISGQIAYWAKREWNSVQQENDLAVAPCREAESTLNALLASKR